VIHDLPLAHDLAAASHQECERIEGAAAKLDTLLAKEKKPFGGDQAIGAKRECFGYVRSFLHSSDLTVEHCGRLRAFLADMPACGACPGLPLVQLNGKAIGWMARLKSEGHAMGARLNA
jgi:hypothetical protein